MSITRRDFLNGVALTIAAGLTPAAQLEALAQSAGAHYPPALLGLRGQHDGSFEVAHALAREGRDFGIDRLPVEERYDLVVVGAGISGLAAAWFYRRKRPGARILILDNHDDFGGHARRNEFTFEGRTIIGYGGSESIQSPRRMWSRTARRLLRELGVDIRRFDTAFDRTLYYRFRLSRGLFFPREAFGRDVLVTGDSLTESSDPETRRLSNARPATTIIGDFPVSPESRGQLLALYQRSIDPLAGRTFEEKRKVLKTISYRDYLTKLMGCSEEVANCFQGRTLGFFGLGIDAVSAEDVRQMGYPGFRGLGLPKRRSQYGEPYIYHFPDGNASLARLLVRGLIPGVAPGRTMDDVVTARFDYGRLDRDGQRVRIRLNSTCVNVRNAGRRASVGYVRDGRAHRIEARHVVLACFHNIIPHLMPDLPAEQRAALSGNVKTPIVYTSVLTRNWEPWARLNVHDIGAPMSFHSRIKLDFPVSLGGYRHPSHQTEPMVVHMVHVPGAPNQGLDARSQFRAGQAKLMAMTFADFEVRIRDDLNRMLGPGGFSSERDIAAITVNRWPHGYSYVANSLFDPEDYDATVLRRARQRHGSVAIANTDCGGDAWAHFAIDQAARAVRDLVG